jgi:hypothetical protein
MLPVRVSVCPPLIAFEPAGIFAVNLVGGDLGAMFLIP